VDYFIFIDFIRQYGYIALFFIVAIGLFFFPVPNEILLMSGGLLATTKLLDPIPTFLVLYSSILLHGTLLYIIGQVVYNHSHIDKNKQSIWYSRAEKGRELLDQYGLKAASFSYFFPSINTVITASTFLIGIGSGFFYALYSIFAKISSRYYGALTITSYTYFCAALFMVTTSSFVSKFELFFNVSVILNSLGLAIIPTIVAFLLYTKGLSYIESSRASILSTIEPVVAIGVGFLVFKDVLSIWQWLGVCLVISSIILATMSKRKESKKTTTAHAS